MSDLLLFAGIFGASLFVWDLWRLVRKQSSALDRDQDILDQITVHEPETMSLEEAEVIAIHVADMTREQAIFAFMDAYDERYSNERH